MYVYNIYTKVFINLSERPVTPCYNHWLNLMGYSIFTPQSIQHSVKVMNFYAFHYTPIGHLKATLFCVFS